MRWQTHPASVVDIQNNVAGVAICGNTVFNKTSLEIESQVSPYISKWSPIGAIKPASIQITQFLLI